MKNFWKWILGIVIVLVVLFGLGIGARLLLANVLPATAGDYHGFMPMMNLRGMDRFDGRMSFGGGFMRLGGLVPLLLLGLLVYGAYRLGRRNTAFVTPLSTPPAVGCPKCGQPVQAGWNHCASCGEKL